MRHIHPKITLALLVGLAAAPCVSCSRGLSSTHLPPASAPEACASGASGSETGAAAPSGDDPSPVEVALSLKRLQQALRNQQKEARHLGGVNRVRFVMKTPDDVILVGAADARRPPVHVDDLAVALRNALGVPGYDGVPIGCTIDPRHGQADPWSIQEVKVFGMPVANTHMAARHVALDYELKRVGAGLLGIAGVEGTFAARLRAMDLCRPPTTGPASVQHRFWFYPATPPAPRFAADGDVVEILRPVGVKLLTERELRDDKGVRQAAAEASPEADRFATQISTMLQRSPPERYQSLVADFQIIEVAMLIRRLGGANKLLDYLLAIHPLDAVDVKAFVAGVFRDETSTVLCDARIEEERAGDAIRVRVHKNVQTQQVSYRGGVEARIAMEPEAFDERPGRLAPLIARVLSARPPEPAFSWAVELR
jgi:hypothetical protein